MYSFDNTQPSSITVIHHRPPAITLAFPHDPSCSHHALANSHTLLIEFRRFGFQLHHISQSPLLSQLATISTRQACTHLLSRLWLFECLGNLLGRDMWSFCIESICTRRLESAMSRRVGQVGGVVGCSWVWEDPEFCPPGQTVAR